ncbi:MAG: cellulase family glycosylhydrolase [Lachnospiraceae bacterium]|jgi:Cellulase (glycosyl hydrolase family 5).
MRKNYKKILSLAASTAAFVSMTFASVFAFSGQKAHAAVTSNQQTTAFETTASSETNIKSGNRYEFEYANRYEQNGKNRIENSTFSGYSGSGYLYLESGWGEVSFNVATSGNYKLTIITNADSYKENFLYLDENSAGTLYTSGNKWEAFTQTVYLTPGEHKYGVSTDWGHTALDYVIVEPESTSSSNGMYVRDGRLYDADGKEFLMRGINVAHAWYPNETQTSINAIADRGANCVRVVLADGTQWNKTQRSEVENIISWCESRGLICILEVHDHTGYDDVSRLNNAVNYWLEIKDLINAHKKYVILNIANEWLGTWNNASTWTSAYQSAICTLRDAGIENVIMIDTSGYGQETSTCINNSQRVVSADKTGNTMISIHMYSVAGKDSATVKSNIDSMLSTGVCFCIGEFGNWQNGADVDETTIMQHCTDKGIGYIAWSWNGNSGIDLSLDIANDWQGSSLTEWGNYVFYADDIGIKDTSRFAY